MTLPDRLRAHPDLAAIHPHNLAAFAERLDTIGIRLDVDLDQHREQWEARRAALSTKEQP